MKDIIYMQQALTLAEKAMSAGEVPVGAVVVDADGQVIGAGHNETISRCSPSAHAEILAMNRAAKTLHNHRLTDCTMYVTLEPCPMCSGAIIQARLKRVVFACRDFKMGACGGVLNIPNGKASNHSLIIDEGILTEASAKLLQHFFEDKR